ncbi:hypothetical protein FRACA_2970003 [Frankia canadensis]|uniref:Uncharacterized protein n=1 Tax=Frankia canadensis TaxID=1836972 RepID=A0A2I2KTI6_9ACTN|nr:hypothetical protein FRACA_2970003 [Frankia canadensis]SOU56267.1 hypothetical protein FRACA_2970003 [Frankia canadensis]
MSEATPCAVDCIDIVDLHLNLSIDPPQILCSSATDYAWSSPLTPTGL